MQRGVSGKYTADCMGVKGCIQSPCEIPLTKGYVALVDPEDFERFGHLKWCANKKGPNHIYATRNKGVSLHRSILDAPAGVQVDHINHNTLDCRRSNLRLATRRQNLFNRHRPVSNTGFIGVECYAPGRYRGRVAAGGSSAYTRTFDCPIMAAVARDVLASQLHGDFATLNFQFERTA